MKLKDISRTATFAWDTSSSASPQLVTGNAAGALDATFSTDSKLEIWAPTFYERDGTPKQGYRLGLETSPPAGSISIPNR
jgi:protein transport protein SEC31